MYQSITFICQEVPRGWNNHYCLSDSNDKTSLLDISFGWTISMSNNSANSKLVNILFKSFCSIRYSCTLIKFAYYSHQKDLLRQIKEYPM